MEHSYPGRLQVWPGWPAGSAAPLDRALLPPFASPALAEQLHHAESLHPASYVAHPAEGAEPYTLQWFLDIEHQRYLRRARWLPHLLEFTKHAGETLLGVGDGLGTDWVQYARHGASVVACCETTEQLNLVRRNFELRGLEGRYAVAGSGSLPVDSASIDVVCVNRLQNEGRDAAALADEVYRVLKPGGKVLALAAAKYDAAFWSRSLLPWRHWFLPAPSAGEPTYSARRLRKVFSRFVEHRVHKRHLVRGDLPYSWRWMPLPLVERVMGRLLVIKAFKPLSAAMMVPLAA